MNFVDKVLVTLADPNQRTSIFNQEALELMLNVAYEAGDMGIAGPYTGYYDELRLGFAAPPQGALEGAWQPADGAERTQAEFRIAGLGGGMSPRIDAIWRGAVSAKYANSGEPIEAVESGVQPFPALAAIDAEIVAAAGPLPTDPAELEDARREQLRIHTDAAAPDPGSVTRRLVDSWLDDAGVTSVEAFLDVVNGSPMIVEELKLTFAAPAAAATATRLLPIAAVILIRDDTQFSLAGLLSESKEIFQRIPGLGLAVPRAPATRPRRSVLIVWVIPADLFDDSDWPGATPAIANKRAARANTASQWLAQEGICLVTVT